MPGTEPVQPEEPAEAVGPQPAQPAAPGPGGARADATTRSWTVTGDPEADALVASDALALVVALLLDQQFPIERAFAAPAELARRLSRWPSAAELASCDLDELVGHFCGPPALHRFPTAMARRTSALCVHLVDHHGGDAAEVWAGAVDAVDARRRLVALPGYGDDKARILLAVLGKRWGGAPSGWVVASDPYGAGDLLSVADVDGPVALERLRQHRSRLAAAGRDRRGRRTS